MTTERVDSYFLTNKQMFPDEKIMYIREKMLAMDESRFGMIDSITFKNPTVVLIISICLGWLGIDRFMVGDIGLGILKLCTFGGGCIWWFIDIFLTYKKAREQNFAKIMTLI